MKKLWIISELFYPDETSTAYILTKVANKLVEKYNVSVYCGTPESEIAAVDENYFTLDDRVDVQRFSLQSSDKNNLKLRSLYSIILSFATFFKLLFFAKSSDKVLLITNPVTSIPLVAIAKKIKNFQLIILVHDVFPENAIPAGILKSKKSIIYKVLKNIFDRSYASANQIIVLGRDMQYVLAKKMERFNLKKKIDIIENWGDINNIFPMKKEMAVGRDSPLLHHIVFQYAGNLGRVQGLMELLEIIKETNNPKLLYTFVGEGAIKKDMVNFVESSGIKNVAFSRRYNRNEQNDILNKADIAIVTLATGMLGLGVPSKVYNILAAGKAILYLGDPQSEIFIMVNEKNIGYAIDSTDRNQILSFFQNYNEEQILNLNVKSANARKLAEECYSEKIILEKFLKLI